MDSAVNLIASIFYKYDNYIIFLLFLANLAVFFWIKLVKIRTMESTLNPKGSKKWRVAVSADLSPAEAMKLEKVRDSLQTWYSFYANITAIFPLLGLLGTVAALIKYSSTTDMMENLMVALTTTLFGVFFAIVFKVLDPVISSKIDVCIDDANAVLRRASGEELRNYVPEQKAGHTEQKHARSVKHAESSEQYSVKSGRTALAAASVNSADPALPSDSVKPADSVLAAETAATDQVKPIRKEPGPIEKYLAMDDFNIDKIAASSQGKTVDGAMPASDNDAVHEVKK